ncbi:MAG: TonB-dependent receptor plug domain-containing protein [Verrucomicrobiota bacterium]
MPLPRPLPSSRVAALLAAAICFAASGRAQTAPAPSSSSSSSSSETVTLSPFEVSTDRDVGYTASATLAGGRLNSDLRDTAAAISVFTKDFLDDIAVTNVNQALEYGLNVASEVEPTGNLSVENNFNFRIRGITGAQRSRNLFRTQLNLDSYNTERLDFSRGPNAILFGEGSPAGLINTSTKVARIGQNFTRTQLRAGSFGERRGTLDINRKLGSKFAGRVNLLYQDSQGYREFEFNDKKAAHFAGIYRPFKKTTIKAEYEKADYSENRARPWTPVDRISAWIAAGRQPIGSPTSWGEAPPAGTANGISSGQVLFFPEGPLAGRTLWTSGNTQLRVSGGPATVPGINTSVNILDETLVPRNANIAGGGALSNSKFEVGGLSLEQQIGDDLFIELATQTEYEKRLWANPIGFADLGYRVDINAYFPTFNQAGAFTGTVPNPNYLRPIAFGNRSERHMRFFRQQYRATASYNLDFAKILRDKSRLTSLLGRHRLAAMISDEGFDRDIRDRREVNVSPNRVNAEQLNIANNIVRVSYIDFFSDDKQARGARDPLRDPIVDQNLANNVGRTVQSGYVNNNWTWQKTELETQMFAMQNFFLKDRLVTTFGWRKDELKVFTSDIVRVDNNANQPATGFVRRGGPDRVIPGDTFTRGIVGHVTNWASLYYNESDNFTSQDAAQVFGVNGLSPIVGNRTGKGKDAGVKFRFFGDKLHATLGWYRTSDQNQVSFINGVFTTWVEGIWAALGQSIDMEGRDTRSLESKGYELEITANPTRRLRFSFNAKKAETIVDNLLPTVATYIAANAATWRQGSTQPTDPVRYSGIRPTVGEAVSQLEQQILIERAPQGRAPYQDREVTGSVFGTYRFDSGALNGLTFGGGAQYRGPSLITYRIITDGKAVYTDAYTQASAMIGYSMKLSRKIDWRIQFNVDNLFNFMDPQPVQGGEPSGPTTLPTRDGVVYTVSLPVPRRYAVTMSFGF